MWRLYTHMHAHTHTKPRMPFCREKQMSNSFKLKHSRLVWMDCLTLSSHSHSSIACVLSFPLSISIHPNLATSDARKAPGSTLLHKEHVRKWSLSMLLLGLEEISKRTSQFGGKESERLNSALALPPPPAIPLLIGWARHVHHSIKSGPWCLFMFSTDGY